MPIANNVSKDVAYHLHSFTNLKQHTNAGPAIIHRGEGVFLYDMDGRQYLDGMASLWCATLGYSESRLIEAATAQMRRLPYSHTFRGRSHDVLIELAEKLVTLAPGTMSKAYFAGSGSEANESAIKLIWLYNQIRGKIKKRKIIAQQGGYHGSAIFTAGLSGMPAMHGFPNYVQPDIVFVGSPHHYAYARSGENEAQFSTRLAMELEQTIQGEGADSVAAFIAEPVMGVGGVILPPETYFEKIQAVLKKYDVLLIADEVICGFGRTGNMFGSITFNMKPDIITVAKGMSSAYFPISATIVPESIYATLEEESGRKGIFRHGFTYSGHPVGAAVALEAIRIYEERDILSHVRKVGERFQAGMRGFSDHQMVDEVRGIGLMAGIQLVADKKTKAGFPSERCVGNLLVVNAEEQGLFVRAVDDTIVIAPPLIITDHEVDILLDRLECALEVTADAL